MDLRDRLIDALETRLAADGVELVDVRVQAPQHGGRARAVCLLVDLLPDGGVTIDDCVRVSRDVGAYLDELDLIPFAYTLEVSSPGVERPLRTMAHYARMVGESVEIRMARGFGERLKFSGTLVSVTDDAVRVRADGEEFDLPVKDIAQARAKLDPWKPRGTNR